MSNEHEWRGQLWLGRDYGLVHGRLGRTAPHAHYAHQLIIAGGQPLQVSLEGTPQVTGRLFIESLRTHAIMHGSDNVLCIYAEPLMFEAQALQDCLADVEPSLPAIAQAVLQCPRRPFNDPRIGRALQALDGLLAGKVSAASLAAQAHVSLSQLERLFARQVGLPVRRLVLWRRLRLAMALMLSGSNLTVAAHDAGFADAAHLSRSLKKIFGVTASQGLNGLDIRLLD
ncbi:AraC family transcriptional regulator [Pseudomonas sp. S04]|uniref:helix-turn-helix domain-containing protein n=1 Tax=unclassified Pseudomonas TaxID=196821 RepID=UPI00131F7609|nr:MULTISPECIES: AraC family transcriptional regulator [unclassified Pseudomonas]QHD02755.1 AraC family transcriptional regulator [Pseudomonas sp. S04]QHF35239.1 AraC family transcriptional regulator [Pseudomonas sp. S19]